MKNEKTITITVTQASDILRTLGAIPICAIDEIDKINKEAWDEKEKKEPKKERIEYIPWDFVAANKVVRKLKELILEQYAEGK